MKDIIKNPVFWIVLAVVLIGGLFFFRDSDDGSVDSDLSPEDAYFQACFKPLKEKLQGTSRITGEDPFSPEHFLSTCKPDMTEREIPDSKDPESFKEISISGNKLLIPVSEKHQLKVCDLDTVIIYPPRDMAGSWTYMVNKSIIHAVDSKIPLDEIAEDSCISQEKHKKVTDAMKEISELDKFDLL
ncbi:MAG: hypothetical protein ACYTFY_22295, partial [Planctomycetota bacterium]